MESCSLCPKGAEIHLSYTPRPYCGDCFTRYLQKRIWAEMRSQGVPARGSTLHIQEGHKGTIALQLLAFLQERNIQLSTSQGIPTSLCTLDEEAHDFLSQWMQNRKPEKCTILRPLRGVSHEELNAFAQLQGMQPLSEMQHPLGKFVQTIQQNHPQTLFAIKKTIDGIHYDTKKETQDQK